MFILGEANNNYIICTLHLFLVKVYGTANKKEFNIQLFNWVYTSKTKYFMPKIQRLTNTMQYIQCTHVACTWKVPKV